MKSIIFITILVFLNMVVGCSTGSETKAPEGQRLAIKIRAAFTDHRYTYLVLTPDGELSFGGGSNAANRISHRIGVITQAQRTELVEIINQYNLLKAKGSLFKKPEQVEWQVDLAVGDKKRSFQCVDDDVSGVESLHDKLFDIQATMQYKPPPALR